MITTSSGEQLLATSEDNTITNGIIGCTNEQRLRIIDSSFMGIYHQSWSIGDEIWLTMRSCIPYTMRCLETRTCQFKDGAYVHDIMESKYLIRSFKSQDVASAMLNDEEWLESFAATIPFPLEQIIMS